MIKRLTLSERVRLLVTGLMLMSGILLGLFLLLLVTQRIPVLPFGWIAGIGMPLYIAAGVFGSRYLRTPYAELAKIYQQFVDGQIYEELFGSEYVFMPEWNEVMKKFKHLLNKQDAIRMSKKQAEYLALQNQINPHFLYNTLEAI